MVELDRIGSDRRWQAKGDELILYEPFFFNFLSYLSADLESKIILSCQAQVTWHREMIFGKLLYWFASNGFKVNYQFGIIMYGSVSLPTLVACFHLNKLMKEALNGAFHWRK